MPKKRKTSHNRRKIGQYAHAGETRANNPPAGLVTPGTDPDVDGMIEVYHGAAVAA
ncbi:MAG: hypothetical protein OD918_04575 [Gammaproteobacteria bacterium]